MHVMYIVLYCTTTIVAVAFLYYGSLYNNKYLTILNSTVLFYNTSALYSGIVHSYYNSIVIIHVCSAYDCLIGFDVKLYIKDFSSTTRRHITAAAAYDNNIIIQCRVYYIYIYIGRYIYNSIVHSSVFFFLHIIMRI